MGQLMTLLNGTLEARGKVLVKLNVAAPTLRRRARRAAVGEVADGVASSPTAASPSRRVVEKRTINTLIPALKDAGATDILELPISKIVHVTDAAARSPTFDDARRPRRRSPPTTARATRSTASRSPTAPARIDVGTAVDVRPAPQARPLRGDASPAARR